MRLGRTEIASTNPAEQGDEWPVTLAYIHPAGDAAVSLVLAADIESEDGRSEWVWIRFENGDLALGVFPQGDTYDAIEAEQDD
jgi:hypothetical protein